METTSQTPVQAIQELVAIHSTRIELAEKLLEKDLPGNLAVKLEKIKKQSQDFTTELMGELSNFGDAVMGSVDNNNPYQTRYKETLANMDQIEKDETDKLVNSFEETLKSIYQGYADNTSDEFKTLHGIIARHISEL